MQRHRDDVYLNMKILRFRGLIATLLAIASTVTPAIAHPESGIVVDRRGYVYFVDTGSGVWMIDPRGKLTRHDGPRFHWMARDESKRPFGAHLPSIPSGEISAVGVNPTLLLSSNVPLWLSYSPDLRHWGSHKLMMEARRGSWWDANKIGLSPPPIETP